MSATLYYRKGVSNLAFGDFILSSVGIVTCSLGDRAGQVAESNGRQVLNRVLSTYGLPTYRPMDTETPCPRYPAQIYAYTTCP
eukprot:367870-Rhodomonas_salina.2